MKRVVWLIPTLVVAIACSAETPTDTSPEAGPAEIGPEGGIVAADGTDATVEVPAGAFSMSVAVSLRAVENSTPAYTPLATLGHALRLSLPPDTVIFGQTQTLVVTLPLDQPVARDTVTIRVLVSQIPGENLWYEAAVENGHAKVRLPAAGLSQIREVLNEDQAEITFFPENVSQDGVSLATSAMGRAEESASGVTCADYPPARAGWPAPGPLRRRLDGDSTSPTAIILIHGWNKRVLNCEDFASKAQSGEDYFARLLPVIEEEYGSRAQILVYTYPSHTSFDDTGYDLATRLAGLAGVNTLILIGHSMGGLVARSAAQRLLDDTSFDGSVAGIITLGTPHLGAFRAWLFNALFLWLETPGSSSLERGLANDRLPEAPTYAHAGELGGVDGIPGCLGSWNPVYAVSCRLGLKYGLGANDGIVGVTSAVPSFFSNTRVHLLYDHSEMKDGNNGAGDIGDALFSAIVSEISGLLPAMGSRTPIAYWRFDEVGGAVASDATTRGNDGQLNGDVTLGTAAGVVGAAAEFGAGDSWIEISKSDDVTFGTEDFTIALWFNTSATQEMMLFNTRNTTDCSAAYGPGMNGNINEDWSGRGVRFGGRDNDGIGHPIEGPTGMNDGAWHHMAGVRRGTSLELFIDGVLVAQDNTLLPTTDFTTTLPFRIGKGYYCGGAPYEGLIDEFRIYDAALTAQDILDQYNAEKPTGALASAR